MIRRRALGSACSNNRGCSSRFARARERKAREREREGEGSLLLEKSRSARVSRGGEKESVVASPDAYDEIVSRMMDDFKNEEADSRELLKKLS